MNSGNIHNFNSGCHNGGWHPDIVRLMVALFLLWITNPNMFEISVRSTKKGKETQCPS